MTSLSFTYVWLGVFWWQGATSDREHSWQVSGAVLATCPIREHSIWCRPTFEKRSPSTACEGDTCFLRQQLEDDCKIQVGQKTQSWNGLSLALPLPITSVEVWSETPEKLPLGVWQQLKKGLSNNLCQRCLMHCRQSSRLQPLLAMPAQQHNGSRFCWPSLCKRVYVPHGWHEPTERCYGEINQSPMEAEWYSQRCPPKKNEIVICVVTIQRRQ